MAHLGRVKFLSSMKDIFLTISTVTVRLHPIAAAPLLSQTRFKVTSTQPFSTVVKFLRRKLGLKEQESVFCYINNVFSPALDEGVGNLWRVSFFWV
jgi:ubiquitin-like protein ATG12